MKKVFYFKAKAPKITNAKIWKFGNSSKTIMTQSTGYYIIY
jgi:hypothetical protein